MCSEVCDAQDEFVKVQGSDVYFHCEVCEASVLELNTKLRKLELELLHKYLDLGIDDMKPEIRIWIRSDGGDMHSGLSAMDCISNVHRCKVRTIADGVCSSAATFLLLGGRTRHATENSYILIHQLNMDGTWGRFEDFKDQMANLDQFMKRFKKIYMKETAIPEDRLEKFLTRDIYMDAHKCVKWNVIDSIWGPPPL
jgi:ATP-dependent Clp endopeptidase proteolytic subunit ClpP